MSKKANILIVHGFTVYPLRSTIRDLLYCYKKYAKHANCFYLNLHSDFALPSYLHLVKWDLIIFHTTFLSGKWNGNEFFEEHILNKSLPLAQLDAVRIIMPQDEWIHCDMINRFIEELKIHHVFSVSPESEWPIIYKGIDQAKVKFHSVLTGYIDEEILAKINELKKENPGSRPIDVGYRAFRSPPWLGKAGYLKTEIAEVFQAHAPGAGLSTDISTRAEDTISGDKWYEFMLRCRYFIGVEGGSTVLDPKGEIWHKGENYMTLNPHATYKDVEQNVFKGIDGSLHLLALSPRHLEACITETAQVLVEGKYNGILKPGVHYIELKKNFSNLSEVLEKMKDESLRKHIAQTAYREIGCSAKYTYAALVNQVISASLAGRKVGRKGFLTLVVYLANKVRERRNWKHIKKIHIPPAKKNWEVKKEKVHEYLKFTFFPKVKGRVRRILNFR